MVSQSRTPPFAPDARVSSRWCTNERAVVWIGDAEYPCEILDMNIKGARIRLDDQFYRKLPPKFEMELLNSPGRRGTELVWQRDRDAGVEFGFFSVLADWLGVPAWFKNIR